MNTKLLRGATLSLGAATAAALAVGFVPRGVAAAVPDDELLWWYTLAPWDWTSLSTEFGITQGTGSGSLNGWDNPFPTMDDLGSQDGLTADGTVTLLGGLQTDDIIESATFDITGGDPTVVAAIPVGSVIDETIYFDTIATETVEIPGAGLFGLLPEITETLFTPWGDFSI